MPQHPEWKHGDAGKVLREFLQQIGIQKDITFQTLRACFATHLLATGVEAMKGIAQGLNVIPGRDVTKNVIPLFS